MPDDPFAPRTPAQTRNALRSLEADVLQLWGTALLAGQTTHVAQLVEVAHTLRDLNRRLAPDDGVDPW